MQKQPLAHKIASWLVPVAAAALIFAFLQIAPPGLLEKADAIGYAVCHRLEERSFSIDGRQMPLCARCSGMYLGAVLGMAFLAVRYPRQAGTPPKWALAALVLFGLAFAVDGSNSYLYLIKSSRPGALDFLPNLYIPNNTLRLFTGTGMGLAISTALYISFNQTFWQNWNDKPVLGRGKDFAALVALAVLMNLLLLPEWSLVLYPAAFLSAGGVLLLLSLVYAMLWLMLMRQENSFLHLGEAWVALLAGLTVALLQITVIDLFRLWLTGTWGGFPLP